MADSTGDGHKDRPRACAYCNRSKTKCIWPREPGDGSCQRCTRLKRPCSMPENGERRRRGPSTRVGHLEEKIDGIMSLLNASRGLQQLATPPSTNPSPPSLTTEREIPSRPIFQELAISNASHSVLALEARSLDIVPGFPLTVNEADTILNLYRSDYSPKFPFVPIGSEITALELFESRPFVFRVIAQMIAPQNATTQREVAQWVRQHIAKHVIAQQERRMELLQGLLLYIGWANQFNFCIDFGGTTLFSVLVGMALEAGLNRPVKLRNQTSSQFLDEARRVKGFRARAPHTLEDMRVILGVFYLNSIATSLFYHMPMLPYSAYLDTCRKAVESAAEYESDEFLSILVRMQSLACRMHYMFQNPEMDGSEPVELTGSLHMAIATTRRELEALWEETPARVRASCMFDLCYKGILVRLYEPVIYMNPSSTILITGALAGGAWRSEALWFCLEAAKRFLVGYQNTAEDQIPYLPCQVFSYFSFTLVTATRLLSLSDSDWNQAEARRVMNFHETTRQLSEHLNRADRLAAAGARKIRCTDDGSSFLSVSADKLRWIGAWYLSKEGPADEMHQLQPPGADGCAVAMDVDPMMSFSSTGFDNVWWEGLLGGDFSVGQATAQGS
ncbi:hypothetical protein B0T16DRAFT_461386 [Cercophora newfieldiana]|uniref:Zn(2)-C6 fungal-type domain-containing protein n=1 Tax=Cercophora newfieldiana TaxID=92897 RepID=A0AA39XW29_9PEZI|nr:hypothetical protein B0T16DRAFT_461386 [Cercophora newfieldiana]